MNDLPERNADDVLPEVHQLASHLSREDGPLARAVIAGSLRRKEPKVTVVDLVVEPKLTYLTPDGMTPIGAEMIARCLEEGGLIPAPPKVGASHRVRRSPWGPRLWAAQSPTGLRVNFSVVMPPAQWPVILMLRTGTDPFVKAVFAKLQSYGYRSVDGRILTDEGREVPVRTEADVLSHAGLPPIPPSERDLRRPSIANRFHRLPR